MTSRKQKHTRVALNGKVLRSPISPSFPSSTTPRFAGIEGLRAVAAVSIVIWHCFLYAAPDGQRVNLGPLSTFVFPFLPLGVTLFFTLSGFLLYWPFAAAVLRGEPLPNLGHYLRCRTLRILPAYWVILLVTGVGLQAALIRNSDDSLRIGSLLESPALLLSNLALAQGHFPSTLLTGIGPAWSLGVEAVFYLVLPLLALLAFTLGRRAMTRTGRRLAVLTPVGIVFVIGLAGKLAATVLIPPGTGPSPGWDGDWHSVLERSFLAQADLFTFGMLLAVLWTELDDGLLSLPSWWYSATAASVAAVAAPTALLYHTNILDLYVYDTLMALACGLLLALVVLPCQQQKGLPLLVRLLESRPLVMTGAASYSLFLWHEPLIRWLQAQGLTMAGNFGFIINLAFVGVVAGLAAAITYRFIELPTLRRKRRSHWIAAGNRQPVSSEHDR